MSTGRRGRAHNGDIAPAAIPCPAAILDIAAAIGVMMARADFRAEKAERTDASGDLRAIQQ